MPNRKTESSPDAGLAVSKVQKFCFALKQNFNRSFKVRTEKNVDDDDDDHDDSGDDDDGGGTSKMGSRFQKDD